MLRRADIDFLTGPMNTTPALSSNDSAPLSRSQQVFDILYPSELTTGADYVALILPHQGGLVVEATFVYSTKLN